MSQSDEYSTVRVFVRQNGSEVLVRTWHDGGGVEVAERDHAGAVWGPPLREDQER